MRIRNAAATVTAIVIQHLANIFIQIYQFTNVSYGCMIYVYQVVRALDSGDDVSDLSNGMKYGQSTVYDSGQYDKDIMLFRRMGNGSFDFDAYSREYNLSREASKTQHNLVHSSSSGESESRAFNKNRTRSTQS